MRGPGLAVLKPVFSIPYYALLAVAVVDARVADVAAAVVALVVVLVE